MAGVFLRYKIYTDSCFYTNRIMYKTRKESDTTENYDDCLFKGHSVNFTLQHGPVSLQVKKTFIVRCSLR